MKHRNKIFCIGLNKTGTTSLHHAFKILGYKSVHFVDGHGRNMQDIVENNLKENLNVLNGIDQYDAYSDFIRSRTSNCFKELDKQYPGSKFILNTRNIDSWLNSREKHVRRNIEKHNSGQISKNTWRRIDIQGWKKLYKNHHESVRNYFKGRGDDFIEFDLEKGDSWEKLCTFLDCELPNRKFPRSNVASKKLQKIKNLILRLQGLFK